MDRGGPPPSGRMVTENGRLYEEARQRVEVKLGFYRHALITVGVCALLIGVNLVLSPGYHWFWWPLAAMAFSLLIHGLKVFAGGGQRFGKLKEDMIRREMDRRREG